MSVVSVVKTAAPHVKSAVKKFYGKPMTVTSKVLGVASTVAVIYDAHINGKERACSYNENKSADVYFNQYKHYMGSSKDSATLCKMKKWWFNVQRDFPLDNVFYKACGYLSGFGKTVARELPVLALSTLTLAPKNTTVNKVAGTLLAANGLTTLFTDVMGIGADKPEQYY